MTCGLEVAKALFGAEQRRVAIETRPLGASRSSVLHVPKDTGLEGIDNLPQNLGPHLLEEAEQHRPIALGIDVGNRGFDPNLLFRLLRQLEGRAELKVE